MRNDSSIKKYYHCSSSRHRAHHRRTTKKSPFPRSGSTSDTRDPFVNRYPTHPVIRKACRPRKGQRIPIPRKRLYRCKETARARERTNERTNEAGGRASERAAPILAARQGRGRERGLIVDVTLRTLSAFRSSGAKGVCVCSCRVQAHPRATRYIDNTRTREASHGWRGGRRREETDTEQRERERENAYTRRGRIEGPREENGKEWVVTGGGSRNGPRGGARRVARIRFRVLVALMTAILPSFRSPSSPPARPCTRSPPRDRSPPLPPPFSPLRLPTTRGAQVRDDSGYVIAPRACHFPPPLAPHHARRSSSSSPPIVPIPPSPSALPSRIPPRSPRFSATPPPQPESLSSIQQRGAYTHAT